MTVRSHYSRLPTIQTGDVECPENIELRREMENICQQIAGVREGYELYVPEGFEKGSQRLKWPTIVLISFDSAPNNLYRNPSFWDPVAVGAGNLQFVVHLDFPEFGDKVRLFSSWSSCCMLLLGLGILSFSIGVVALRPCGISYPRLP